MAAEFTRDEVAAVAALANLELDADEVTLFARQLGEILAYVDELRRIDTTGIPPTAGIAERHNSDRADEVRPSLPLDDALANAPDAALDAGLFKVPRVIG
jgi:aspartyl-tRNA(Asn)/glutamyl-tRNA(Gln) amidotransferase subunit C